VPLKLILANKAYSSWSLRPWILLAQLKIPFEEVVISMDQPDTRENMLKYAPTGKCPSLQDGKVAIWESLAIIEYLAEAYPGKTVWPKGKAARAHARALANEMHAGFLALRQACPTNFRRPVKAIALSDEVRADVARIEAAWAQARATFGRGGPFHIRAPIWRRSWLSRRGRLGSQTRMPNLGGSNAMRPSDQAMPSTGPPFRKVRLRRR
jgi:glutathione S-transferase